MKPPDYWMLETEGRLDDGRLVRTTLMKTADGYWRFCVWVDGNAFVHGTRNKFPVARRSLRAALAQLERSAGGSR